MRSTWTTEKDARSVCREAAARAHAPYSGFRVGAVLEDEEGNLHAGCNLESASIGLSLCAERAALAIARAHGARGFRRLWIYTATERPTPPCGACRELLMREAPEIRVILLCDSAGRRSFPLRRLLPASAGLKTGRRP